MLRILECIEYSILQIFQKCTLLVAMQFESWVFILRHPMGHYNIDFASVDNKHQPITQHDCGCKYNEHTGY